MRLFPSIVFAGAIAVACGLSAAPASAQFVRCADPLTKTDIVICNDDDLTQEDLELQRSYASLIAARRRAGLPLRPVVDDKDQFLDDRRGRSGRISCISKQDNDFRETLDSWRNDAASED